MNDETSHTITLRIPDAYWDDISKLVRMLREMHRDGGGTSRLVRGEDDVPHGRRYTLTLTGAPMVVSESTSKASQIQDQIIRIREKHIDDMLDILGRSRSRHERQVVDMFCQGLLSAGKRK